MLSSRERGHMMGGGGSVGAKEGERNGAERRWRNRHQESEKRGAGKGKGRAKPHALKVTEQTATHFGEHRYIWGK